MQFSAKDNFSAAALKKSNGDGALVVQTGDVPITLDFAKTSDFQRDVQSAISLLESKGK